MKTNLSSSEQSGIAMLLFAVAIGMLGLLTNDIGDRAFLIGTMVWPLAWLVGMVIGKLTGSKHSKDIEINP
jgi:hypothetical protein